MYTVYVIQSDKNKIYIGQTIDIETRLKRHNKKMPVRKSGYTYKNGIFWKLVYREEFPTRSEAIRREKELKSHKGREFIKRVVYGGVCRTA